MVLETTGIAEPAAILEGLSRLPDAVRRRVAPAGVICVVDATCAAPTLARRDEAREQVTAADRLLLSKLDLATVEQVSQCHAALDGLAPVAERASFPSDDAGGGALAEWLLSVRSPGATAHHHHHAHRHGQLVAASFVDDAPLLRERLLTVIRAFVPSLVRIKGFVHLAGEAERGFLELAGDRLELRAAGPWPAPGASGVSGHSGTSGDSDASGRRTELVFIGDQIDEAALHRALWACRAGG